MAGFLALLATACRCGSTEPPAAWLDTVQPAEPRRPLRGWDLVRGDGTPFTERDLVGRTSVVFVGYTRCPDVCPGTLAVLARLPETATEQIVFLSVDPDHDREGLDGYTRFFDDRIVGVTGSRDAVDHAVGQLGAGYTVRDDLVDHSTNLFVVDENANLAGFVLRPESAESVQRDLATLAERRPPLLRAALTSRPAPPGAPGVAFGTLLAAEPVTIRGWSSPDLERVELHRTVRTATTARMEPVPALSMTPEAPATLAPGGLHVMLHGASSQRPTLLDVALDDGRRALVGVGE